MMESAAWPATVERMARFQKFWPWSMTLRRARMIALTKSPTRNAASEAAKMRGVALNTAS